MGRTYGKSTTVVVDSTAELVVEAVVTKGAVEVDDGVGTLMTPGLLFSVAIVVIPAMHIAPSITNQITNLKICYFMSLHFNSLFVDPQQ